MSTIYFGLYTLIIAIIWGFFIILRLHAIKFDNFQTLIGKNIKILFFILLALTIVGYTIVFMIVRSGGISELKFLQDSSTDTVDIKSKIDKIESVYY